MSAMMQLEVLTPDKKVLDATTESLQVYLPDGWWGVLAGHAPFISYIHTGVVHYSAGETQRFIALYQGTLEVQRLADHQTRTRVLILTAAAEEGASLAEVQTALEQQAAGLAALAKEANLEFNQLRLSLERSLKKAEIMDMRI